MKIIPSIDVDFQYQDFGTSLIVCLTGKEEEIELAYNSVFNGGGVKRLNLEYQTGDHTRATFRTDRKHLLTYFTNLMFGRQSEEILETFGFYKDNGQELLVKRGFWSKMERLAQELMCQFLAESATPLINYYQLKKFGDNGLEEV